MNILVSACLLGIYCRYDGGERTNEDVLRLRDKHTLIPFCPEIHGGLMTPREPSEIVGDRVLTKSGQDVTRQYEKGAGEAVKLARLLNCQAAVLQDRSPSCGVDEIHNGDFDGGLIPGDGVTARALREAGIRVIPASRAGELLSQA